MQDNYWSKFTNRRMGRRRALAATGGFAAAAAFLAACGGNDDDDGGGTTGGTTGGGATPSGGATTAPSGGATTAPSGLLTQPVHIPPAQAKKGGVLRSYQRAEPRSLDINRTSGAINEIGKLVYENLLDVKPGLLEPSKQELTGSLAESWEVTPDGLQTTFKLRKGVKFHDIAPVNGHDFDSTDVLASFERSAELNLVRGLVWASAGAGGPALAPTAPDANTVVLQMTEPISYILNHFAPFGPYSGSHAIVPREANGDTLDLNNQMVGTGPFFLAEHEPSVRFDFKKNLNHWDADNWLLDEISMPIVPEYASRNAQLQAGNIYHAWSPNGNIMAGPDVLAMKNDQPAINLYEGVFRAAAFVWTFGHLGENQFADERVRQAISMSWDRDLDLEIRYNIEELEDAGIPIGTRWNSHTVAYDSTVGGGWWLDPKDASVFGENAKNFQYNVPEGKKLLTAAGYPDGFEFIFNYPEAAQFSATKQANLEPFFGFLQDLGLTVNQNPQTDYTQEYGAKNRDASGAYEGIGWHSTVGGIPAQISPVLGLGAEHLATAGNTFHGYSADGGTGMTGDPALIEILSKARLEQDVEAAKALVHEAQRYLGKAMWSITEPGGATTIFGSWPAIQNTRVWQGGQQWEYYQVWLDDTKAPLA